MTNQLSIYCGFKEINSNAAKPFYSRLAEKVNKYLPKVEMGYCIHTGWGQVVSNQDLTDTQKKYACLYIGRKFNNNTNIIIRFFKRA